MSVPHRKTIVITGANGFLGTELCRAFAAAGWQVRAGVRRPKDFTPPSPNVSPFQCKLPEGLDSRAFRGADVCIHAAWSTRFRHKSEARHTNFHGTAAVLRACRRHGVRFVFISSCSAHERALSFYGRSKLAVERRLDPTRDLFIRPGLILGDGGLFERMKSTLERAYVVPLFDGGRQPLQTIHVDDLCAGVLRAVEHHFVGLFVLAEDRGSTMTEFMRELAARLSRRPLFVPFPLAPALAIVRAVERFDIPLPISSENLLGLRGMIRQPAADSLARLDLHVRSVGESLNDLLKT